MNRRHPDERDVLLRALAPEPLADGDELIARFHLERRRLIQLSETDVFRRVQAALHAREGLHLCRTCENSNPLLYLGRYFISDPHGNPQTTHVDLLALARGMGALADDERCPTLVARRRAERADLERRAQILRLCRPTIVLR